MTIMGALQYTDLIRFTVYYSRSNYYFNIVETV